MRLEVRHRFCGRFGNNLTSFSDCSCTKLIWWVIDFINTGGCLFSVLDSHCHWDNVRHIAITNIIEFDYRVSRIGQLLPELRGHCTCDVNAYMNDANGSPECLLSVW